MTEEQRKKIEAKKKEIREKYGYKDISVVSSRPKDKAQFIRTSANSGFYGYVRGRQMNKIELKPCPICGSAPRYWHWNSGAIVECWCVDHRIQCEAKTVELAAEAWNRRIPWNPLELRGKQESEPEEWADDEPEGEEEQPDEDTEEELGNE